MFNNNKKQENNNTVASCNNLYMHVYIEVYEHSNHVVNQHINNFIEKD